MHEHKPRSMAYIEYLKYLHIAMVLTDSAIQWFSLIQARVRLSLATVASEIPFCYEGERFFPA